MKLIEQISNNLDDFSDVCQTIELLCHMTCFDVYKAELLKKKPTIKKIFDYLNAQLVETSAQKHTNNLNISLISYTNDSFNLFYGVLQIAFNFCLDKKHEMIEHYKRNYEISDEDFRSFEEMQMKYNNTAYQEGVQFMTYDQKTIKEFDVKTFLTRDLKIIKILSYFIENHQKNFSFSIQVRKYFLFFIAILNVFFVFSIEFSF